MTAQSIDTSHEVRIFCQQLFDVERLIDTQYRICPGDRHRVCPAIGEVNAVHCWKFILSPHHKKSPSSGRSEAQVVLDQTL
jgi:hypothetical protein